MDGAHEADRVIKVGAEKQQVAIAFGDSVNDGRKVAGRQRIDGLVDDPEAIFLGISLRAENGIARKLSVR